MTSAAQPNPIEDLTAQAELRADELAEQQIQPKYTGGLPDDPEQAVHYRPGADGEEVDSAGGTAGLTAEDDEETTSPAGGPGDGAD